MTREATILIVTGLRDHVPGHWQTLLASRLLDCKARIDAIEREAANIDGPIVLSRTPAA